MMYVQGKKIKKGDKQPKKLHNRVLTLFSCTGELSHRHHLTSAANLRGAGGPPPPPTKPVPNRIEPLRTKAAKFGGERNKKTQRTPEPWRLHPSGEGVCTSWGHHGGSSGKRGAGSPHLPSFGRDASITQHRFPPSLSSPSFCSSSRAFRTHLYIGVTPITQRGVGAAKEIKAFYQGEGNTAMREKLHVGW